MAEIAERELALGRASRDAFEDLVARMDEARGVAAAVLGSAPFRGARRRRSL